MYVVGEAEGDSKPHGFALWRSSLFGKDHTPCAWGAVYFSVSTEKAAGEFGSQQESISPPHLPGAVNLFSTGN